MDKSGNKLIKIAGMLNIVEGAIFSLIPYVGLPLAIYLIGLGALIYNYATKDVVEQNKTIGWIIIAAILCFSLNPISSILILLAQDKINNKSNGENAPPKVIYKKKEVDPEVKKIDLLLKLGVGMVFISGILFATTTWSFINNYFKAIFLIILGVGFLGLSKYTEEKLKLEKSSYIYWLLGMSFLFLTIVGVQFFGIFGEYLTYSGEGKYLAYAITFMTFTGLSYTTSLKYDKNILLDLTYVGIMATVHNLCLHINGEVVFSILILSIIAILFDRIIPKGKHLKEISIIAIYVLAANAVMHSLIEKDNVFALLASIMSLVNITLVGIENKDSDLTIFNMILTHSLLGTLVFNTGLDTKYKVLLYSIFVTSYTYVVNKKYLSESTLFIELSNVIYSITMLISVLYESDVAVSIELLLALLYLVASITTRYELFDLRPSKILRIFEPLSIFFIVDVISTLVGLPDDFAFSYELGISALMYCTIDCIFKENGKVYSTYAYIFAIIGMFLCDNVISTILPMAASGYLLYDAIDSDKKNVVVPYLMVTLTLFFALVSNDIFNFDVLISSIIVLCIYGIILLLVENEKIKKATYFLIILPLFALSDQVDDYTIEEIVNSALVLYGTFLVMKFLVKDNQTKNILSIIGVVLALIGIIFETDILIGLYVGIIGIVLIIIGYKNNDFFPIFITGIVIEVLNIIVQLFELWKEIPFWLYLLVTGIGIIGFVTYKESKKLK